MSSSLFRGGGVSKYEHVLRASSVCDAESLPRIFLSPPPPPPEKDINEAPGSRFIHIRHTYETHRSGIQIIQIRNTYQTHI